MKTVDIELLLWVIFALVFCIFGQNVARSAEDMTAGRTLFLKNCAHCHGANAYGDEGPDLHKLDESDAWIANRIRKGKPGQMTAFAGKLQPAEINSLISYLRTLK